MNNYLITWFYAESKGDESFYPSVGGDTTSPEFQKVYWECVYDFYKSALLTQHNNIKYMFFTNVPNIPTEVDSVNISEFFKNNNIEVVKLELTNKTPTDWYGAWRNQFYLFDVLDYLKNIEGNHLILDSDCFITKDLTPVFSDIEKNKIIEYDCGYTSSNPINGISIEGMKELYKEFYKEESADLSYKGGEFIGLSSSIIPDILNEYRELWEKNYVLYEQKKTKLNEEAHFLSVIYAHMKMVNSIADNYIKRLWTAYQCDNIEKNDANLSIWHLPAEKGYAFNKMFNWFKEERTEEEYIAKLKKLLLIEGSTKQRKLRKAIIKVTEKIKKALESR